MNSATSYRPDASSTETERSVLHHYVPKNDLMQGIVDGRKSVALCGRVFIPSAAHNTVGQGGVSVCPECRRQFHRLAL